MTRKLTATESQVFEAALRDNDLGITTNEYRCVPALKNKSSAKLSKRPQTAWNTLVEEGFLIKVPGTPTQGGGYVVAGHPLLEKIAEAVDTAKAQATCDRLQKELAEAQLKLVKLHDFKRIYGNKET